MVPLKARIVQMLSEKAVSIAYGVVVGTVVAEMQALQRYSSTVRILAVYRLPEVMTLEYC